MRKLGGTFSHLLDDLVRERTGLAPSRRHEEAKQRLLGKAMERAGVHDEAVYLALLRRDAKTYDDLIADLTVPETYFFRDPAHYQLLRGEVLPAILGAHARSHVVEVWSAGCATGEEPYSLAILLEQEKLSERSFVLGTDVSHRALSRARAAVYSRWSLRATSDRDARRYFEQDKSEFRLAPRIRARARFQQHSLSSGVYPLPHSRAAGFDLILCRNVLIYFDPKATQETSQRLARSLSEDGWLVTGPSDPVLDLDAWCDLVPTPCGMLYRRRHLSAQRAPTLQTHDGWQASFAGARRARVRSPEQSTQPWAPQVAPVPAPPARAATVARTRDEPAPAPQTDRALAPVEQVRLVLREHGSTPAEAACRDLLERHPLLAELHGLHALLLVDLARDGDAAEAARRAVYLDRTLVMMDMLIATMAERRGDAAGAARTYGALAQACRARAAKELVPLGDGLTHEALAALAEQREAALSQAADETR